MSDITRILSQMDAGDPQAAGQLLPLVYDELRKLATAKLTRERPGQTLQATALVHEAYLRLVGSGDREEAWDNRGHFFAAAAEAMRRILVESARRKGRQKRGGGWQCVDLDQIELPAQPPTDELVAIDEALVRLEAEDPTAAKLVKLRFFAGLSLTEAAEALGISRTSAYEQWSYARAWLRCAVAGDATASSG